MVCKVLDIRGACFGACPAAIMQTPSAWTKRHGPTTLYVAALNECSSLVVWSCSGVLLTRAGDSQCLRVSPRPSLELNMTDEDVHQMHIRIGSPFATSRSRSTGASENLAFRNRAQHLSTEQKVEHQHSNETCRREFGASSKASQLPAEPSENKKWFATQRGPKGQ